VITGLPPVEFTHDEVRFGCKVIDADKLSFRMLARNGRFIQANITHLNEREVRILRDHLTEFLGDLR
jgi:hypothetical protein